MISHTLRSAGYVGDILFGGEGVSHPKVACFLEKFQLIDFISKSDNFESYSNLTGYLNRERFSASEIQRMIEDNDLVPILDGFPEPGRSFRSYWSVSMPSKQLIPISGSFGCRYSCNFCFDSKSAFYIRKSVQSVIEEIKFQAERYQFRLFGFCDPNLNSEPEWFKDLCRALIEQKVWVTFAHLRVDCIDDETLRLLPVSGFHNVNIGLESLSHGSCLQMDKGYDKKKDVAETIIRIAEAGIPMSINIFSSYPGMEAHHFEDAFEKTSQLIHTLSRKNLLHRIIISVHPTRIDPHARLYRKIIHSRIRKKTFNLPHSLEHFEKSLSDILEYYLDAKPDQEKDRLNKMSSLIKGLTRKPFLKLIPEMGLLTPDTRLKIKPDIEFSYDRSESHEWKVSINTEHLFNVSSFGKQILDLFLKNYSILAINEYIRSKNDIREDLTFYIQKFALELISRDLAFLAEDSLGIG